MKTPRILVIAGAGIALALIVALTSSANWERKQTPFHNAPKLLAALQAFSHDQAASNRPLPPEVSLRDLLRGGYLTTNDVRDFEGMDVVFTTKPDNSHPQDMLAHARTPSGQFICLLADGSVQLLSRERFEQQRAHLGQPGGP
jgi:hypothetical protein